MVKKGCHDMKAVKEDDSEVFIPDVDPESVPLAKEAVLIDGAEFNERERKCRDVDVKLARGAEGAAAENSTKWF